MCLSEFPKSRLLKSQCFSASDGKQSVPVAERTPNNMLIQAGWSR